MRRDTFLKSMAAMAAGLTRKHYRPYPLQPDHPHFNGYVSPTSQTPRDYCGLLHFTHFWITITVSLNHWAPGTRNPINIGRTTTTRPLTPFFPRSTLRLQRNNFEHFHTGTKPPIQNIFSIPKHTRWIFNSTIHLSPQQISRPTLISLSSHTFTAGNPKIMMI